MGYNTEFEGVLKFRNELSVPQLKKLEAIIQRVPPRTVFERNTIYNVDLELTDEYDGLKWNGAEKTYDMDVAINYVVAKMRESFPEFTLVGALEAVDDYHERFTVYLDPEKNGRAAILKKERKAGKVVTCPHCEEPFELEEE